MLSIVEYVKLMQDGQYYTKLVSVGWNTENTSLMFDHAFIFWSCYSSTVAFWILFGQMCIYVCVYPCKPTRV